MDARRSNSFSKILFPALLILIVTVVVASYLLIMLMGYGLIFFTVDGLALSVQSFPVYVLLFFLIGFSSPFELNAGVIFSFVWIVYVSCFVAAWKLRESFHDTIRKAFSRPFRNLFGNFLFIMPLLSGLVLTAVLAIVYSQEVAGVPTGQPTWPEETPLVRIFLDIVYAPVVEEFGFRIVPLGLSTLLYVLMVRKKNVRESFKLIVAAFLYPEGAKRMAGLRNVGEHGFWRGISVGEWALIVATSVIFGLAHIISGIGWEVGKFTSVFVQGFFFALTYLAYGFEAPILLHWFFNYYLFFFEPDVTTKFFPTTVPLLLFMELIILALGIAGWTMFAVAGLRKLLEWKRAKQWRPQSTITSPS